MPSLRKLSMLFRLDANNVGVAADTTDVVSAHSVIVIRVSAQPDYASAGDVANVQILIPAHVGCKRTARRYV